MFLNGMMRERERGGKVDSHYANGLISSVFFNKSGTMMKVHCTASVYENPRSLNPSVDR
jgi:hypothetical protein